MVVTGPIDTRRVTQLGVAEGDGVGEGVNDGEGLGDGNGLGPTTGGGLRCASSRTIRTVTASPAATAIKATLASTGCNQRMVRGLPGTQSGGVDNTSPRVSR
jgi:hypothetical protein